MDRSCLSMFSLNWWGKSHASPQSRGKNMWWPGRNLIRMTIKILRKPCHALPPSRTGQMFYSGLIICKKLTMPGLMGSHELCFGINIFGDTDNWQKKAWRTGTALLQRGHVWSSASPIVSTLWLLSLVILTERPLFHLCHWPFLAFLGNQESSNLPTVTR